MTILGLFTCSIYSCVLANRRKYNCVDLIIFIMLLLIGVLAGSRLLYAAVNYKNIIYVFENIDKINITGNIFDVFRFIFGGSVFYGGLIGAILAGLIIIKKNDKYRKYIDIVTLNIPLFHFFGRIGCFLGGCCYGIPCKVGFTYTHNPIIEANGIVRFPAPLFEALFNVCLFFLLNYLFKKRKIENALIYVYLIIYSTGRFFIEFLRGDAYRGFLFGLSTSQIISIIVFCIVVARLCVIYRKNKEHGCLGC
ncbi:MAG: prolipoprotein diacylglyceryl transferase [Treponema sp.]|nr:prolipoprotein diacylglyceryl transferase [Treponema sp.]